MSRLTYPEVGATRSGELPAGYRRLRYRILLAPEAYDMAGEAVLTWRMHRAAGIRMRTSAPRAEPGAIVASGLGVGPVRLWAPCEVVWSVADRRRTGFGYGTLPGHPARGEEAFVVDRDDDGQVWFRMTAFSLPARWFMRAAGPLGVAFQQAYARRLGRTLRRLSMQRG